MKTGAEVELAGHVIAWLQDQNWTVYQEVEFRGSVADIVATQGQLITVVEAKRSYGFAVLEQAVHWLRFANYVWVSVWDLRRRRGRRHRGADFGRMVAEKFGIGVLNVEPDGVTREAVSPEFRRKLARSPILRDALREEHRTAAQAGTNRGGRYTPFRATCDALKSVVLESPGIQLKDAIGQIEHHYMSPKSARSSLVHWIQKGKVRGVRLERDGRRLLLQVADA